MDIIPPDPYTNETIILGGHSTHSDTQAHALLSSVMFGFIFSLLLDAIYVVYIGILGRVIKQQKMLYFIILNISSE